MEIGMLALACASFVAPATTLGIIKHESKFNPWAIGVNGSVRARPAENYEQAVAEAKRLIAQGHNIDMGLMQVNSTTMKSLGLTVENVFDPCTNIYAGATVLYRFYVRALEKHHPGDSQKALLAALSAYNTGSFTKGFSNGYVSKVMAAAQ